MSRGPDFLGIGASRSGSTWLQSNLRRHPGIWMAPVMELHYFDFFRTEERCPPRRRGENPRDLLMHLFDFLGVERSEPVLADDVERERNTTKNSRIPIPPRVEEALARLHLEKLEVLADRFGARPEKWLRRVRAVLQSRSAGAGHGR